MWTNSSKVTRLFGPSNRRNDHKRITAAAESDTFAGITGFIWQTIQHKSSSSYQLLNLVIMGWWNNYRDGLYVTINWLQRKLIMGLVESVTNHYDTNWFRGRSRIFLIGHVYHELAAVLIRAFVAAFHIYWIFLKGVFFHSDLLTSRRHVDCGNVLGTTVENFTLEH